MLAYFRRRELESRRSEQANANRREIQASCRICVCNVGRHENSDYVRSIETIVTKHLSAGSATFQLLQRHSIVFIWSTVQHVKIWSISVSGNVARAKSDNFWTQCTVKFLMRCWVVAEWTVCRGWKILNENKNSIPGFPQFIRVSTHSS